MKKIKMYQYATWGLLLINISMVAFFLLTKPDRLLHRGENLKRQVSRDLKLDKNQRSAFLQSAKEHSQKMDSIKRQQKELLHTYFRSIIDTSQISESEIKLAKALELEQNKIEFTYQHFQEVRSLLRKDQYPDFEVFMERAMARLLFERKRRPPSR